MDPVLKHRRGARRPCLVHHHHHHHHHHLQHQHRHHHHRCYLFQHQHQNNQIHCFCNCHCHANPNLAFPPQNPQFIPPCSLANDLIPGFDFEEAHHPAYQMLEEHENGGLEEEDDDDPVFVLTDEWKELFAKSEAERKLKKKQANKGKT